MYLTSCQKVCKCLSKSIGLPVKKYVSACQKVLDFLSKSMGKTPHFVDFKAKNHPLNINNENIKQQQRPNPPPADPRPVPSLPHPPCCCLFESKTQPQPPPLDDFTPRYTLGYRLGTTTKPTNLSTPTAGLVSGFRLTASIRDRIGFDRHY